MRERIESAWLFARKVALSGYAIFGVILFGIEMAGRAFGRDAITMPWEIVIPALIAMAGFEAYHKLRMENKDLAAVWSRRSLEERLNTYRKEDLQPFTNGLSKMFYIFKQQHASDVPKWEIIADSAAMSGMGRDDRTLQAFADEVYPDGESASAAGLWLRGLGDEAMPIDDFKLFHDARRNMGNLFSEWNMHREDPVVEEFLVERVLPNHRRNLVMLSYLERPLAVATSSNTKVEDTGWYQLGVWMDEKKKLTQETDEGYEIPVPKRREFFENLEKASEPDTEDEDESDRSAGREVEE